MKFLYLHIVLMFVTVCGYAQNLVPNYSFEQYDTCNPGQNIFIATGWKSYSGTPDYYHGCADSSSGVSVPYNLWGYEPAPTGVAYSGFYSYESTNKNVREYVGKKLSVPLVIGTKYFVSFKIKPMSTAGANCANSGIGLLFSTQSFTECLVTSGTTIPPPNRATIYSSAIISDTTNWTTVGGYFNADSAYQYFEIGTLFSDSLIDTLTNIAPNPYTWKIGYYLLDDVVVEDSLTMGVMNYLPQNYFNVYPNPFNTNTTVRIKTKNAHGVLRILDFTGNEVEQINITGEETIINRAKLSNGIYFLQMKIDNRIYTQKLIIN